MTCWPGTMDVRSLMLNKARLLVDAIEARKPYPEIKELVDEVKTLSKELQLLSSIDRIQSKEPDYATWD